MKVVEAASRQQRDYAKLFQLAKEVLRGIRADVFSLRKSFLCGNCEYGESLLHLVKGLVTYSF